MPAKEPGAAPIEQTFQHGGHLFWRLDAIAGKGFAVADLDADVGSVQPAKRLLVGDVVADEHRRRCALLVPQDVERLALVGLDHRELQYRLAMGDLCVPVLRGAVRLLQRLVGVGGVGVAHVQRDAGRFDLDGDAGVLGGDRAQRVLDLAKQRLGRVVDRVHEAGVELGTVAADQMDLGGHS